MLDAPIRNRAGVEYFRLVLFLAILNKPDSVVSQDESTEHSLVIAAVGAVVAFSPDILMALISLDDISERT